jgi:hypothetical protein
MLPIVMDLALFSVKGDEKDWRYSQNSLKWLLEALTNCDREYLRLYPETPMLYDAGVKYAREDGTEDWAGIRQVLKRKCGDCEDLAAWRAAELRERFGEPARAFLRFKRTPQGFWHYHIKVLRYHQDPETGEWVKWYVEDPSYHLGMGWGEAKPMPGRRTLKTNA